MLIIEVKIKRKTSLSKGIKLKAAFPLIDARMEHMVGDDQYSKDPPIKTISLKLKHQTISKALATVIKVLRLRIKNQKIMNKWKGLPR